MKVCTVNGCPELTHGTRCTEHKRQHDRARGNRQTRGYNTTHDQLRRQWTTRVATGTVHCARCGHPIPPNAPWALDHTNDRTGYLGPSHQRCNAQAGGQAAHH